MIIYEVHTDEVEGPAYYPNKKDACRAARMARKERLEYIRAERERMGDDDLYPSENAGIEVVRCVTVNPDKDGVIRMIEGRGWLVEREVVYRTKGRFTCFNWNTGKEEEEEG